MKLAYKTLDNVIEFPLQKHKPKAIQYIFQLVINLSALYMANKFTVDIWRSLTGH
jgi:hypothetical protein